MRIVILTSNRKGTAAYCLPILLGETRAEVVQVIYCERVIKNKPRFYKQKFKKIFSIGFLGALNGMRMRKWYSNGFVDGKEVEDIETVCQRTGIPFALSSGINSSRTIELMRACQPDLGLSLGNSYISSKVFTIPVHGMLNIHGEVLPRFQNAQSVIWQIYEGNPETGYTIHKVDKTIDTGEILKQEKFPIIFKPTLGQTVSATCAEILKRSAIGLAEVIKNFEEYDRHKIPQGHGQTYTTPSFRKFLRILGNFRKMKKENSSTK
ncbi:formyltransferase family protein [Flavitalea flava]